MKRKYTISMIIILAFSILLIGLNSVDADVNSSPKIDVEIVSISPAEAKIGEDITVSGVIKAQPFEIENEAREVILVLDVSGSMEGEKLAKLKTSAKSFINKVKEIDNVKVAIVAYSSEATINPLTKEGYKNSYSIDNNSKHSIPNYISCSNKLMDSGDERLAAIIDNLEALGGTNTGEGLRKAAYLLEKSSANKTIVFMSDGLPTFYSITAKYKELYTNIDNSTPKYAGSGQETNSNIDLSTEYACKIGDIIKNNVDNVYSIGYDLGESSSNGNKKMKEIHDSMGGMEDKIFTVDERGIEEVFNHIAVNIIESYTINNMSMKMNFPENSGIKLNIGDDTIELPPLEYKKVSENSTKVRYEAEDVPFNFVIKGSNCGKFELFTDSLVNYVWDNVERETKTNSWWVEILNNELPNIKAKLISSSPNPSLLGEEVEVVYNIIPEEFEYNSSDNGTGKKDVVILIDTSAGMKSGNRWLNTRNGLDNQFVSRFCTNNNDNVRFSIITYNKECNSIFGEAFNNKQSELHNQLLNTTASGSEERNIGEALMLAMEILEGKEADEDASKNIVMISSGEVDDNNVDLNAIRDKNYNIISVELQEEKGQTIGSFKGIHNYLGGSEDCYISWKPDGGNYNNPDAVMKEAADKLSSMYRKTYSITNAKLYFDLGMNISSVSGLTQDNGMESIDLGEIKYKYNAASNKYSSDSFNVSFKIKSKACGELRFGKENYLTYNSLIGKDLKVYIETPKLNVNSPVTDLKHGLYEGIVNGKASIDVSNNKEFAADTNINFAASFTFLGNSKVCLTVDNNGTVNEEPKIYKIENSQLIEVGQLKLEGNNNQYTFELSGIEKETQFVVLYGYKINNDVKIDFITNNITVSSSNKDASVRLKKDDSGNVQSLPDLF